MPECNTFVECKQTGLRSIATEFLIRIMTEILAKILTFKTTLLHYIFYMQKCQFLQILGKLFPAWDLRILNVIHRIVPFQSQFKIFTAYRNAMMSTESWDIKSMQYTQLYTFPVLFLRIFFFCFSQKLRSLSFWIVSLLFFHSDIENIFRILKLKHTHGTICKRIHHSQMKIQDERWITRAGTLRGLRCSVGF